MSLVIGRRLLWAIPSIILTTALLFFCVIGLLGSPAAMMLGRDATPEAIKALDAKLGFDRPMIIQYLDWMRHASVGDFGRSFSTPQTVAAAILPRLPVTFELSVFAILLAVVAAVALNSNSGARTLRPLATLLAVVGVTAPNFVIGLAGILLFSVQLSWLPTIGWVPWSAGISTHLLHILLPVVTLSAHYFGSFTLVYRAEFDNVRRRPFVRAARAKGLSERQIAFRHVMPNSVLPVITYVGLSLGQLIGGAVVVETLFAIPGIGSLFVDSILQHDFPVMLAISEIVIIVVILLNVLADLAYGLVNPQIRLR